MRSWFDQCFRLVRVELQSVLHIPLLDVTGTRGENGQSVGCVVSMHGETELHVVSILMVLYSVAGNDIGHRAAPLQ